ncbi:MAG TPA: TRAP transporter small permease [Syntrophorhabdaceae bacterium]|nr:TRAP transporter small permease [Syntrophorhabdaceae bacterium]
MSDLVRKITKVEEGVLACALLGIALFTFVETFLRYTVSYTFSWFQEVANYTIIFTTFLGASVGVKYGVHFSMEALPQALPDSASHLLKSVAYFLSGLIVTLFVVYGFKHLMGLKSFDARSSAMQIPMYIPYAPIPLFSIVMAFRFFILSGRHMKAFIKKEPFEHLLRKD